MYLHDDAGLFEEALLGAAAEFSLSEEFVSKDYWAMAMLAEVMRRSEILVFKGGTCLSKCYGAISRFSEDVGVLLGSRRPRLRAWWRSPRVLGLRRTRVA